MGLWKAISKEAENLKQNNRFYIGNGIKIRFWEDKWCKDVPIYESFPNLYGIVILRWPKLKRCG